MKNNLKIIIAILIVIILGVLLYFMGRTPTPQTPDIVTEDSILGCYVAHLEKDIYTLKIQSEENGNIIGMLAYNNYQKDSSSGSFVGTFENNILMGNYSFDSEGMHSDRQVIFKKVGKSFIQGFGPTKVIEGKETFDPIESIVYDPKSTFIKSDNCTESFTAPDESISFDYNPYFKTISGFDFLSTDWQLNSKQKGMVLASVYLPKTYMPQTNFSDAKLTIGRSANENAIRTCTTNTNIGETKSDIKTISGYPFTKFTFNGAATGNFYETTSYRGIVDGDCYAIEYTIHSTNIENYSPGQGIKEFNKTQITDELEKIITSFKFLINSD